MGKMEAGDFEELIADLLDREAAGDYGAKMVLSGLSHYSHKFVHDHNLIGKDLNAYKRHKWLQNWIYARLQENNVDRRKALENA